MATADPVPRSHDRQSRRRPFSSFMKRLANLKSSSEAGPSGPSKNKKSGPKNNPYPESGWNGGAQPRREVASASIISPVSIPTSLQEPASPLSRASLHDVREDNPGQRAKSTAPTVSTKADTTHSDGQSKAGTVNTAAGALSSNGVGGAGSTFSSPAPSVRSLTTTVTTVQSAAAANALNNATAQPSGSTAPAQGAQFSHQFPTSPVSAIPSHVVGGHSVGGHPSYTIATANNLLTDNASIVTLASSSKRRRRNSLDTNASVKALAPSSIFGGSRESLPLSVLSGPVPDNASLSVVHHRPTLGGNLAAERASVYSSSGVAPPLTSERSSYYAGKQGNLGDGASIRSGLAHHGRNDSLTGSIGGAASPPSGHRDAATGLRAGQGSQIAGEAPPADVDDDGEKSAKGVL